MARPLKERAMLSVNTLKREDSPSPNSSLLDTVLLKMIQMPLWIGSRRLCLSAKQSADEV